MEKCMQASKQYKGKPGRVSHPVSFQNIAFSSIFLVFEEEDGQAKRD